MADRFDLVAPLRQELDLLDQDAVRVYVERGQFDVIFHGANPNPVKNQADSADRMFEDSMRVFMNFYQIRQSCGQLIYLGSGAEFDKRWEMRQVMETEIGRHMPQDVYGFSKYIMNELATHSENVINLRLFACYGPHDHPSKFITYAINCCLAGEPVTIRQDCWFDYLHVDDFARIAAWAISAVPRHHDYNISSGERITLQAIASEVCAQMGNKRGVTILSDGFNKEYTASNARLLQEIGPFKFTSIQEGIARQIEWQRRNTK